MDRFDFSAYYRPLLGVVLTLTIFACNGGGCSSCEGCGIEPIPGAYPLEHRIDNAAQVRLTSSGIGFIEENISSIVTTFLPDGLDFPIPRTDTNVDIIGDVTICAGNDCGAHIEIESLELSPTDPNQILAHLRLILDSRDSSGERDPWRVDVDFLGTSCLIDIDTRRSSRQYVGIVATITLAEILDEPTGTRTARAGYTHITVTDVTLADGEGIETDDIEIDSVDWTDWVQCNGLNIDGVKNLVIEQLTGQISGLLDGALGDQLCQTRGEHGCPTDTFAVPDEDPESVCRFANDPDAECVPILLGTDGRGDLGGTLIGGFSPGTHAYAQFLLASGGDGEAINEGMSLFFYGGFMGTDRLFETTPAHHSCVPVVEPPPLPEIARVDAFRGNVIPGTTDETHVGIGIAEDYLNYAGYGMFDSGMLCIGAGTRLSQQLSSALVSAAIMSLPELTFPLSNAPLTISVRPQNAPVFSIGSGASETEPLLDIELPQVEIDFYVWMTERYVRFMTFRTDLSIGINLTVEDGQILPMIAYVSANESSVSNSELLAEQPAALAGILETLVGSLASMLGGSLSGFDLPEIMGFNLEVPAGGITRVTDGGHDFLGIFANLALAAPAPIVSPVETSLELSDLTLDRTSMTPETWREGAGNRVWLHFETQGPLAVEYEHSYRIDEGHWSAWTTDERVLVDDDVLLLQARHVIEARSRVVGEPASVDPTPARAELVIDILPPQIQVNRTVTGIEVVASDVITEVDGLEYRYFLDGAWTAWGTQTSVALPVDAAGVLVEVRDESGNVGRSEAALIRGLPNSSAESSCGCRVPGQGGGGLPLGLLALVSALGVVFARRRRAAKRDAGGTPRRRPFPFALFGVLALIALLASGCECSSGPPCGGLCIHATPPSTAGSVCCEATNMCANYDIASLCDPGYTCTQENLVADETCTVSCLMCTAKPDLDPGYLATYLDAVVDDGGQVYVSGYSPGSARNGEVYGDLVFGAYDGTNVDFEIVDGAPSTPITNNPEAWRGGVSAPGDDVGQWTSLVDQGGTFLITYYDVTNGALKMAAGGPGAWQLHTIDETGDSGRYSSLVLDAAGVPAVAYLRVQESPETPGQIVSSVMVARANLANPSAPTDWTITEVAQAPALCRPQYCGSGTTCIEDGQCVTPTTDCTDDCGADAVCFNGGCRAAVPSGFVEDIPPYYGLYTSLATTSAGLALAFYDRSSGNVYAASFDGTTWGAPFLVDGYGVALEDRFPDEAPSGDSGMGVDLAVDSAGLLHLAYIDGAEETVRYAQAQADGTILSREIVDDGSTSDGTTRHTDGRHIIGDDASLVVLETGAVRIVYQDATAQHAVVAVRAAGAGSPWAIQAFDTEGSTGFWLEQELLGTTSYAVTWWLSRIDARNAENGVRVLTLE